jgi:hypothetical protein
MFFGVPLLVFVLHLFSLDRNPSFISHIGEFKYMAEYLRTVTIIIVSLAGLNTVEIFKK